jgi:serine phosphatase RsbU (regulator of sigma subunit)
VTSALAAGDALLLYTDGVTDLPGEEERFGEERLIETVAAAPSEPRALIASVSEALDAFSVGATSDDRAMLALRHAG